MGISPSLGKAINAKKKRKTTEWERPEISSRKLEIPREHFMRKMGSIKDRNGMVLTAEDIKKRWQEYTEELYKNDLHFLSSFLPFLPSFFLFCQHVR